MSLTLKAAVLVLWAFFLASYVRQVPPTTQFQQTQTHVVKAFAALGDEISVARGR